MSPAEPIRLVREAASDAPDAHLRLAAAALAGPASLLVLSLGEPGVVRTLLGLVGLLASVGWLATYRGHRAREGRVLARLELHADHLVHVADDARIEAPYDAIANLDVGDDAATLVVVFEDGRTLDLPPGYGGLGTLSLLRLLEHHRDGAKRPQDG